MVQPVLNFQAGWGGDRDGRKEFMFATKAKLTTQNQQLSTESVHFTVLGSY